MRYSRIFPAKSKDGLYVSNSTRLKNVVTILVAMPEKEVTKSEKDKALYQELMTQLLTLVTSGFGVVAALAWNDAIQSFVKEYVEPRIPGSGLSSRFLYALIITIVIVLITYFLSKIVSKFKAEKEK